jgi:hypothetical protein
MTKEIITNSYTLESMRLAWEFLKLERWVRHTNSESKTGLRKPSDQIRRRHTLDGEIGGHFTKHVHDKVNNA